MKPTFSGSASGFNMFQPLGQQGRNNKTEEHLKIYINFRIFIKVQHQRLPSWEFSPPILYFDVVIFDRSSCRICRWWWLPLAISLSATSWTFPKPMHHPLWKRRLGFCLGRCLRQVWTWKMARQRAGFLCKMAILHHFGENDENMMIRQWIGMGFSVVFPSVPNPPFYVFFPCGSGEDLRHRNPQGLNMDQDKWYQENHCNLSSGLWMITIQPYVPKNRKKRVSRWLYIIVDDFWDIFPGSPLF